jgi:hypothetical protein
MGHKEGVSLDSGFRLNSISLHEQVIKPQSIALANQLRFRGRSRQQGNTISRSSVTDSIFMLCKTMASTSCSCMRTSKRKCSSVRSQPSILW